MRGYDNGEVLVFDANCKVTEAQKEVNSLYVNENKAAWLGDFSTYNGWLGNEEFLRGKVYFGGEADENRYMRKWDGVTVIEPITDNTDPNNIIKYVYSVFDLVSLQKGSHHTVLLNANVDLDGDKDAKRNRFNPISGISVKLDGGIYDEQGNLIGKNSIYNLYIEETSEWTGFIKEAKSGTHKNLTFVNSAVIDHYITASNGSQDFGYAGTLTPFVNGANSYIVDNVDVENGYVFGLGKIGGLIGFVSSDTKSFECKNCDVTGTTVKNEKGKTQEVFLDIAGLFQVKFNAHGEAGGLIGMLMGYSAISNCHVTGSTMDCYGEDNFKMNAFIAKVDIAGRHVNHFIGNVRTPGGQTIKIDDCSATNNTYVTEDGKREDNHTSGKSTKLIGEAYFLYYQKLSGFKYTTVYYDTKGSVKVDGVEVLPNV